MKTSTKNNPNRVWIELEQPRDAAHAAEICTLINRTLLRMVPTEEGVDVRQFSWDDKRKRYNLGTRMGDSELVDHGDWFNLDYIGRAA